MSLLGQETQAQQSQNSGLNVTGIIGSLLGNVLGNVDTSSLLLGLLGGGNQSAAQPQAASGVQSLDSNQKPSGGFLSNLFGKLFGGKK